MLRAARLRQVKAHLAAGGIIAYATESCYGFGCDPFDFKAVRRLLQLKRRPQQKGLILIGANWRQLQPLMLSLPVELRMRAQAKWPGAHTWLMPVRTSVPRWLKGRHERIALRIPAHAGARSLCTQTNLQLVSTSANRSGSVSTISYRECIRKFGKSALVLPGRVGRQKRPSTIEDLLTGLVTRSG
jgi:L-threonylcarbamoyladenylate synthase